MTCSITYSSHTGNTKLLAETLKSAVISEFITYFGPLNDDALKADRIYLGFWTNNGICDKDTQNFIKKLDKQEVVLFGTAGLGYSADYFDKIIQRTRKLFGERVRFFASFMCQGKMPIQVRDSLLNLKKLNPNDSKYDRMLSNFDVGQSHPNKDDLRYLITWLRKL